MKRIGVVGTGIWGTALALTASRAENEVLCWAREEDVVESINYAHVNKRFLPDIPLPRLGEIIIPPGFPRHNSGIFFNLTGQEVK